MSDRGQSSSSSCGIERALFVGLRYDQPNDDERKSIPGENLRDKVIVLSNVNLEYAIKDFIKEDVSILYLTGHGSNSKDKKCPGLVTAVDYEVMEVDEIIKVLKKLPLGTKFLFLIDACYGANFVKMFNKKVAMLISSQEDQESSVFRMLLDERKSIPGENLRDKLIVLSNVNLEYAIKDFIKEDVSILYLTGHGSNPKDKKGPGLVTAVDYEVMEVDEIIKVLKKLPLGTKFLFLIDACYGANFVKMFDKKVAMLISSQEDQETTASIWHGSHFTNAFLHVVHRDHNRTTKNVLEVIKEKLRNLGIDQTPFGLAKTEIGNLPISGLLNH
ncbi:hypothetical protein TSUD_212740 [Trifolium subterraneum]|uniref:Peptidase C14 caspase domain-containing protein n=1 Tax=Trifolium subterraneum TaxID=3900 RepID=A0A2Z6MW53_TRISU|nr:hypothetical protein TSUD_212740 [Trifolium subterraneum]